MTFNKMRFPIVWITIATLCVVLCSLEVYCGPVGSKQGLDQKDQEPVPTGFKRKARQESDDEASDESGEDGSEESDDDEGRSLRRRVREATDKPAVEEEIEKQTVIPSVDTPAVPEKKPSVLELLSSALDKAIEATQKIPTQQVASDAAGVFQILGQVFTEAIDKVIGDDDGPEESAVATPDTSGDKTPAIPANEQPMKLEEPKEELSANESK